ncbi:hypothetical protein GCM10007907_04990 [Chitinimonas prasina]|uniref:Tetratricopeptide repeat protein n=1 Tax=Chitinimonas prasina TaxID=1434937 RepID=A0ABQ5YA79_9NEIS|nr:hypothetical protein [Chitinimonas prasina]GLR11709.1 hypothetical protein GCM10007907_04990 [Chitinimonas prasina]
MREILLGVFLSLACFAEAATTDLDLSREEVRAYREKTIVLEKDVAFLKEATGNRLEAQDKRITDIGLSTDQHANHIAAVANQTTYLGYLIAFIALVGGFAAYFTATRQAKEAANKWFESNAQELRTQIDALKNEADDLQKQLRQRAIDAHSEIDQHATDVTKHATDTQQAISAMAQRMFSNAFSTDQVPQPSADAATIEAVQAASEALESKPERDFKSDDHFTRGLNEFLANRFDSALHIFEKALERAQVEKLMPERHIWLMFARAASLGELGRSEESVAVYDEIDRSFGPSDRISVRELVAAALLNKGVKLCQLNRREEGIAIYDEIDLRFGEDTSPDIRERVAYALFNKSIVLHQLDRMDEEIAVYDEVNRRYGNDESPALVELVAVALFNKSTKLGEVGRYEEAIAICDEIVRCYGKKESVALRLVVAKALVGKGSWFGQLGRSEEAVAIIDEVDWRFGKDDNSALRELVANALLNKGTYFGRLDRSEEAIAVYNEIDRRYGEDTSSALREWVARALVTKGLALGQLDRREEEIASYEEIDRRYGKDESLFLVELVAKALVSKGNALVKLDRREEAIAVYDEVERRFGIGDSAVLQGVTADALNGRAYARILQAKHSWQTEVGRQGFLDHAISDLTRAQVNSSGGSRATILGNLGYAFFLSGKTDHAEDLTKECLRLGGDESLQAQRADAGVQRIELLDSEYETLLDRLWDDLRPES